MKYCNHLSKTQKRRHSNELKFADDMILIAKSENILQQKLRLYQEELQKINMKINANK